MRVYLWIEFPVYWINPELNIMFSRRKLISMLVSISNIMLLKSVQTKQECRNLIWNEDNTALFYILHPIMLFSRYKIKTIWSNTVFLLISISSSSWYTFFSSWINWYCRHRKLQLRELEKRGDEGEDGAARPWRYQDGEDHPGNPAGRRVLRKRHAQDGQDSRTRLRHSHDSGIFALYCFWKCKTGKFSILLLTPILYCVFWFV